MYLIVEKTLKHHVKLIANGTRHAVLAQQGTRENLPTFTGKSCALNPNRSRHPTYDGCIPAVRSM